MRRKPYICTIVSDRKTVSFIYFKRYMRYLSPPVRPFAKSCFLLFFSLFSVVVYGQISYGGKPLPLDFEGMTRRTGPVRDLFVEMPPFDSQAAVWRAGIEQKKFRSLEFAHKFFVHLRPGNSGITFTTDNLKVWRVGIRSKGAYSLNILFSKFRLPEGAKVFVYNSGQTEILGSYTHRNNTDLNLLPVQPVSGDALIVEYQEPTDAAFRGEIEVGEVNHDFLGLFRASEPRDPLEGCHPNLVCYPENVPIGSGVVGLIINGSLYCTGSLINNTAEDGTPYLITATHCLNNDFNPKFLKNRKYDLVAGNIVAFFHYESPLCSTNIRGPLQMTLASADSVLISERHDISLLKLRQKPPKEYQPYYLGWNAEIAPSGAYHGIHHPNGGVKKVAIKEGKLQIGSFLESYNMEPNSFRIVKAWDTGNTEQGSSGSPLLDKEKRMIGTLTGGESTCTGKRGPDLYASLHHFWNVEESLENPHSIACYLDPKEEGITRCDGFNPYGNEPIKRSHNFKTEEEAVQTLYNSVPLFSTNNTPGYTEFAEAFFAKPGTQLAGVFISSAPTKNVADLRIKVRVYSGKKAPEQMIHEQDYDFSYRYYAKTSGEFSYANRDMNHTVENYIRFTRPVTVSGTFFIAYYEANGIPTGFSALNTEPRKIQSGMISTSWMKKDGVWINSSENIENPINTSFIITPYVLGNNSVSVPKKPEVSELKAYYSGETKRIFIEANYELLEWEIFYSSGQKIHHDKTDKSINRTSFSIAHLPKGVYIVKVKTVDGTTAAKKVLVW